MTPLILRWHRTFVRTGAGCEHLGEPLDEWQQEKIGHVWHEFVKHAALTEQRMSAPFGGVGLEVPIVAQLFSAAPRSVSKTTRRH